MPARVGRQVPREQLGLPAVPQGASVRARTVVRTKGGLVKIQAHVTDDFRARLGRVRKELERRGRRLSESAVVVLLLGVALDAVPPDLLLMALPVRVRRCSGRRKK